MCNREIESSRPPELEGSQPITEIQVKPRHSEEEKRPLDIMEKYHSTFWIFLSLLYMVFSYRIGLGSFHSPGPGFMPFFLGLTLFFVASYLFVRSLAENEEGKGVKKRRFDKASFKKICVVMGSLFVYIGLFETLGYPISTFCLLIILFRNSCSNRWSSLVVGSIVIVLVTYLGFGTLGLRLPNGIVPWR